MSCSSSMRRYVALSAMSKPKPMASGLPSTLTVSRREAAASTTQFGARGISLGNSCAQQHEARDHGGSRYPFLVGRLFTASGLLLVGEVGIRAFGNRHSYRFVSVGTIRARLQRWRTRSKSFGSTRREAASGLLLRTNRAAMCVAGVRWGVCARGASFPRRYHAVVAASPTKTVEFDSELLERLHQRRPEMGDRELLESMARMTLGRETLRRVQERNTLSEDEAIELGVKAVHEARRERRAAG